MLRRSWYLAPAAIAVALFLLLGSPSAPHSAIWSAELAFAAVIVLWPLTAGVAAMDQVRHVLSGSTALTDGLTRSAATREVVRRGLAPGWVTSMGIGAALLIGLVVASVNSSTVSGRALAGIPAAVIGSLAFSALGAAIGTWMRSWIAPVLVAVGTYGIFAFDVAGSQSLLSFAGATSPAVVSIEVPVGVMARILGVLAGVLALALLAVAARTAQLGRVVALPAAAGGLALMLWQGGLADQATWQWRDDTAWPCIQVLDDGAELCLPADQQRDLPALGAALAPITQRLAELDETWKTVRYTTVPVTGSVRIEPPFGAEGLDPGLLAMLIAWTVPTCLDDDEFEDVEKQERLTPAALTVAWWAAPDAPPDPYLLESFGLGQEEPSLADAASAYVALASCQ